MVWEQLVIHIQKKVRSYSYHTQTNFRWIKNLYIKRKSLKLSEANIWGGPPGIFYKNCVFILTCLNFSHLQSTLFWMQYTYQDVFLTAQNSFWTHRFWCLLVLLLFFCYGLFNKWCWENCTGTCRKMKLDHQLTLYTRINSRWIKDFNCKSWNHKNPRRKHKQHISDIPRTNIFANTSPRARETKEK